MQYVKKEDVANYKKRIILLLKGFCVFGPFFVVYNYFQITPLLDDLYASFGNGIPLIVRYRFILVILYTFFEVFLLINIHRLKFFKDVSKYKEDEMININRFFNKNLYILLFGQFTLFLFILWFVRILPFHLLSNIIEQS